MPFDGPGREKRLENRIVEQIEPGLKAVDKFMQTFMTRPMHVMGFVGALAMFLGVASLAGAVAVKLVDGTSMIRNPLLHLSVMLELIGVQAISMGLLGELVTRTYFESQGKRAYAVRSTLNVEAATVEARKPIAA